MWLVIVPAASPFPPSCRSRNFDKERDRRDVIYNREGGCVDKKRGKRRDQEIERKRKNENRRREQKLVVSPKGKNDRVWEIGGEGHRAGL